MDLRTFGSTLRFSSGRSRLTYGGRILAALLLGLSGAARADAATITLTWDPPDDRDTAGYIVWFGRTPGQYTDSVDAGFQLQYSVKGLAANTLYCFAVQAYDANGIKSPLSREVCGRGSGDEPPPPSPPPPHPPPPKPPPPRPPGPPPDDDTEATEIVIYASKARAIKGNWALAASGGAKDGYAMRSANRGWSTPDLPQIVPESAFELTFDADAKKAYRVWVRLKARGNSKWNDSIWVQFSDALENDNPAYRLGTTDALLVNLEPCDGCGTSGWGWQNTAYWLEQGTLITFAQSGSQKIQIQTREDGVEIDRIVLSASRYKSAPPGPPIDDAPAQGEWEEDSSPEPYTGTPLAIPGTIDAAHFDHGGANVAYADTSPGNTGGAVRATDVDLQPSSDGGYNIGWTAAGEWVTYTVDVQAAGVYTAQVRAASVGGGALQIAAGAPSRDARDIAIPDTRGWQSWTTVTVPVTLAAGRQTITVRFLTAGVNLRSIRLQRR